MAKTVRNIRNGGRPKINEDERKDKTVSFRVDALTRMALEAKVKESKLAMGEFIRRALVNSEISPAEYEGYFRGIENFNATQLVDLITASATVKVIEPLSADDRKTLKGLYRFAQDVNALVKRGNAALSDNKERINYLAEINRLKDDFKKIKDTLMQHTSL